MAVCAAAALVENITTNSRKCWRKRAAGYFPTKRHPSRPQRQNWERLPFQFFLLVESYCVTRKTTVCLSFYDIALERDESGDRDDSIVLIFLV